MATQDEKLTTDLHEVEREGASSDADKEEKTTGDHRPVYPINDEDYVVTFKTWVVVAILA
jgi:hypothetical protein